MAAVAAGVDKEPSTEAEAVVGSEATAAAAVLGAAAGSDVVVASDSAIVAVDVLDSGVVPLPYLGQSPVAMHAPAGQLCRTKPLLHSHFVGAGGASPTFFFSIAGGTGGSQTSLSGWSQNSSQRRHVAVSLRPHSVVFRH